MAVWRAWPFSRMSFSTRCSAEPTLDLVVLDDLAHVGLLDLGPVELGAEVLVFVVEAGEHLEVLPFLDQLADQRDLLVLLADGQGELMRGRRP